VVLASALIIMTIIMRRQIKVSTFQVHGTQCCCRG
jgi:hypothetical protein